MIQEKLLPWYDVSKRELPWRKTNDPYQILVSEIMLQQTQVSRGLLFYEKWLKIFPDWKTLAEASNAQVIEVWAGLGYNRRALMLRDIAKQVVEKGLPENEEEWKKLKGIGPYTAAAISVFAYKQKAFPIDTNIRRVLGRVFLHKLFPEMKDDEILKKTVHKKLITSKRYDDIFQSLFDLANTYCLKSPQCQKCPLKKICKSSRTFLTEQVVIPKTMIKKGKEKIYRNKLYPDRIYRGKILREVRMAKGSGVLIYELGKNIDKTFDRKLDQEWLIQIIGRLEKDGLVCQKNNKLYLP